MNKILFISSSLHGAAARSHQIGAEFVDGWANAHGGAVITERRLTAETMPHLTEETWAALGTSIDARTPHQRDLVAFADELIAEAEAADVIVIAAPMYNFSIPSTLKAWLDHVARAGRTFRYTADGPEGLLKGKKVIVVASRGGVYSGESPARVMDFQEPYLRTVLGFIGLTDVTFVHVEGLGMGGDAAERGVSRARETVRALAA